MPTHKVSGEPIAVIQGTDATTGLPTDIDVINNAASTYESNWAGQQWPQNQYLNGTASIAATASDNALIYQSGSLVGYGSHMIMNRSPVDPVDIYISIDGTNYTDEAQAVLLNDDVTTGGGVRVLTIPQGKIGVFDGKISLMRVLKVGTTNEAPAISYMHYNK